MTNAEIILDYARSHDGTIVRRHFMPWFSEEYPNGSSRSIDTTIHQMVASGILVRSGYGIFRVNTDVKPFFSPVITVEMKNLYGRIRMMYPYADFCLWQARELSSFMRHIPGINLLILETNRSAAEAVYEDVRQISEGRTILLNPTEREYLLYAAGTPAMTVKNLITESPMMDVDGVKTASLEKILVDATVAPELNYARGEELYTIFENAGQMYKINKKTMLRYAARRGQREGIEQLIKATMP